MSIKRLRRWAVTGYHYLTRSLFSRMALMLFGAVLLSQALVSFIWLTQVHDRDTAVMNESVRSLALSASSTIKFFRALPKEYRHLVLNQLRNIGGTRFFVSLNREYIDVVPIRDSSSKRAVTAVVNQVLLEQLGKQVNTRVEFSRAEDLKLFSNEIALEDLPRSWAEYSLTLRPLDPPILVMQIQLDTQQWFYLAALLPAPLMQLEQPLLPPSQALFMGLTLTFLLITAALIARWLSHPLKRFVAAARAIGHDVQLPPMRVEGPEEIRQAAQAFNAMQSRLHRYMEDRELLFSSISHDLKTPITRIRLRAELIEDNHTRERLLDNLDELEIMVKGALQCVKETDLHENLEPVDISQLFNRIREELLDHSRLTMTGDIPKPLRCKPLAMKRALSNLVDNGIRYGDRVTVTLVDYQHSLFIYIRDYGKGVAEADMKRIFAPYIRLQEQRPGKPEGHGLGLGIARNIIHGHGGTLEARNHPSNGLLIKIELPRE